MVKDLSKLGRNLKRTILIDDKEETYIKNTPLNGIKIE